MSERLMLKGQLADARMRKFELTTAVKANLKAVREALYGLSFRLIEDIDVDAALVNLREAAAGKKELAAVLQKIADIEKELA